MKPFFTIAFCLTLFITQAQYFIPPMDNSEISIAKEAYVVTNADDTVRGRVLSATIISGQLRSFTIKEDDGNKQKFKSTDVKLLAVAPSKLSNISSAMSVPNLSRTMKTDFSEIIDREWVYFEQALLPKKKDKYVMMQLLNPGFDSKIKVYLDPNANQTMNVSAGGINLAGGEDKSYLVVYDGNKSEVYKKSSYKKDALEKLYKNCAVFTENYEGEKFIWKNFAEHIYVYDQLCTND
ncbi:MAG: hypothetical protein RIC30_00445 [Marinoscillum sp.]|uniref:hypothetical protein n=1 Tax=Marinoscillum sp. TaxID=2024838 RepID=UPI0033054864